MATSLKLRSDIKKYEAAIKSKATPAKFKDKLKVQLGKAKSQLESMKSSKAKKPSAPKKKSALDKLKARYKGSGVDIKKDSERPALPLGRRTSKSGNTYYENRLNRADVRQPPKRYPKLEDGGMMADGGKTKKWSDIKKGKIEDLKSEIEYLDKYLKNLENENTKESYEASNKLRNYKATLQAKILNLEDEEYAKGGYMAKGGKILSAINRDRAYKSQESWEQNYVRKNRPKNPKYKSSSNIFEEVVMMAKGGALEHGLMVGDLILMTKTGYGQDTIGVRNQNDGINYLVDLGTGERKNLTIMSHGGELHRTQE